MAPSSGDQKQRERLAVMQFREIYPDFPVGELADGEGPDFIVRGAERVVGIEHTDFMSGQGTRRKGGSAERKLEEIRDLIVLRAQAAYEAEHATPLRAWCHWFPGVPIARREVNRLAAALKRHIAQQTLPTRARRPGDDRL
jgi:hypothetical protein